LRLLCDDDASLSKFLCLFALLQQVPVMYEAPFESLSYRIVNGCAVIKPMALTYHGIDAKRQKGERKGFTFHTHTQQQQAQ